MKICKQYNRLKNEISSDLQTFPHVWSIKRKEKETNMKELEYVSVRERKLNQVYKERRWRNKLNSESQVYCFLLLPFPLESILLKRKGVLLSPLNPFLTLQMVDNVWHDFCSTWLLLDKTFVRHLKSLTSQIRIDNSGKYDLLIDIFPINFGSETEWFHFTHIPLW